MKFEKNSHYFTIALYAFLVIAASMIFFAILKNASSLFGWVGNVVAILQPVVVGFVLAYLLNPLLRQIDDRFLPYVFKKKLHTKTKRVLALVVTYFIAAIVLGLFMAIIVPKLIESITGIIRLGPAFVSAISSWYSAVIRQLAEMKILGETSQTDLLTNNMIDSLIKTVPSLLESLLQSLNDFIPTVWLATTKITTGLLNMVLGVIISIYLLFDREKLFAQLKKIIRALFPKRVYTNMEEIATESHRIFSAYIIGTIIDSAVVGGLCFVGMFFIQREYAVLISVIVAVTNIIPYFGPFIGAIPSFLILVIVDPKKAFIFLLFIFLLQQFDGNILNPKIVGDSTGLSAVWVIFAITFFSGIFGILGMFIGVPLFALIYSLVKRLISFMLKKKGAPDDTHNYDSPKNPLLK